MNHLLYHLHKKQQKSLINQIFGGNPTSHTPAHDMTAAAAPFRA